MKRQPWNPAPRWHILLVICLTAPVSVADVGITIDQNNIAGINTVANVRAPIVHLEQRDTNGLDINVMTTGLAAEDRNTQDGAFVQIGWPDAPMMGEIGAPALPVVRRLILAPIDAAVDVTVTTVGTVSLTSATAGRALRVMPVQPPVPKRPGALERAPFHFDEQAYAKDADMPAQRAVVMELGIVRQQRLMLLEVRPVACNTARQTLTLWPELRVSVRFSKKLEGQDPLSISPLPGLDRVVLNPIPVGDERSGNFVIIVAETYASDIVPFAQAKRVQGYDVTTWPVSPGSSNAAIKTYIQGLWSEPDNRPDFILLVGDTDTVPHWIGGGDGSPATDLPYTCMDGPADWFPDIAIGRFSARTPQQLTAIIDKTLYFENGPLSDPDYLARAVFMASEDNYSVSEGTHNWVIANYMEPNYIESDRLYCHTYNATTSQVRSAFNGGRLFGIYSGHGSETSWADGPPFSQGDVNGLFNADMYSFVCSFSCVTGTYTLPECFCETWIRAPQKGAAAIWGSSVNSYWTEDDVLEKRLFDVLYDDYVRELGPCFNLTRVLYAAQMGSGSTTRRYFEMYNLLGDPSLYVDDADAALRVSPGDDLLAEGPEGGPFTPSTKTYQLRNVADYTIEFELGLADNASWVTLSGPAEGTLAPNDSVDVTVQINNVAQALPTNLYADSLVFTNTTDHVGDCARSIELAVGTTEVQQAWMMDTDPQWSTQGQWAFGQPLGGGSHNRDPLSGHTGPNVYGYNLAGDYPDHLPKTYLTTPPFDCTNMFNTELRFRRWLGIESASYDHASIEVSIDGTNWVPLWEHSGGNMSETSWTLHAYDLSEVADGEPTVYLRWCMGETDYSVTYPGWNIDDVEIWGIAAGGVPGDFDDDGDVDLFDFAIFDGCYTGAGGVIGMGCESPDLDFDGDIDKSDLALFLLSYTGT